MDNPDHEVPDTSANDSKSYCDMQDKSANDSKSYCDVPDKSANDSKSYRVIKLANDLTALLISDGLSSKDDTSLSAAGLCVGVGGFSEPDNLPGLAHFLEHMVFMGSARFPGENDFDKFIRQHGGVTNAHTFLEETVFFFEIQHPHFKATLERFAQFFISPLLNKDSMKRERNLVHAEWAMSVHTERFRFEQLLASCAKPGHPMGKFTWGNSTTLQTIPEKNGVDVHKALNNFRNQYYLAQYMTLAVFSKDSLDNLESWVKELFAGVPTNNNPAPCFTHFGAPFDTPNFRKMYRIIPVRNVRQLQLTWALDSQLKNYRKRPLNYLTHLIGHEGEGSLLVLLRKRNWARSINCGNTETSQEHNSTWAQFSVALSLTDDGLKNFIEVVNLVFQYLNMLRAEGPKHSLWLEMQHIEQNEFAWMEQPDPQEYVRQLSIDMHKYLAKDYIKGGRVMKEYDEQLIKSCLDKLQPGQMNLALWSQSFDNDPGAVCHTEPYYQTRYYVQDIPLQCLQLWSNCGRLPDFFLPRPNVYIASDFTLKTTDYPIKNLEEPISSKAVGRLWYRPDTDYCVPKAYINFSLRSALTERSPTTMCLTDMYVIILKHLVSVDGYSGEMAHLRYRFYSYDRGMTIRFSGFSDTLSDLFVALVDRIAAFELTAQLFDTVRKEMAELYRNLLLHPEKLSKELKRSLLLTKYCPMVQKRECLANISLDDLMAFADQFYQGMFVEGLIQGNVTGEEALALEDYLIDRLNITPAADPDALAETQVTKLPDGCSAYQMMNLNRCDENTVLTNHYQFGDVDLHCQMLNELVVMNMEEPSFNRLRSQQELGYHVQVDHRSTFGVVGFTMKLCSQASRFTIEYLDHMMEQFLKYYDTTFNQAMTEDEFAVFVSSTIKLKSCDDTNLSDEVNRHWAEIIRQTYLFRRHDQEIEELKTITMTEFKNWSKEKLLPNRNRRKLSVQVNGHAQPQPNGEKPVELKGQSKVTATRVNSPLHQISDIAAFKEVCERYTFTRMC